jgi:hypothetical protein
MNDPTNRPLVAGDSDAQSLGDTLIVAAINALRSYEFGNASPDLAKSVADKLTDARWARGSDVQPNGSIEPAVDDGPGERQVIQPLEEPVTIEKAMLAGRVARVVLDRGVGPVAAVHLVNIGITGWVYTQATAAAYAKGFNQAAAWMQKSMLSLAPSQPAAREANERAPAQARFLDIQLVERLFIKHRGHVDAEGWCLNKSGLYDFLHEFIGVGSAMLAPTAALTPEQRQSVIDAIAEALGGAYDCTRVWSAWSVGTMSQDDFALVAEDGDRLDEITDAVIQALATPKAPSTPVATVDGNSAGKPDAARVAGVMLDEAGFPMLVGGESAGEAPTAAQIKGREA